MRVALDFETRSACELNQHGVYAYADHATTDVWCAAYAVDDGPVSLWLPGQPFPEVFALADELRAWNANFERTIWNRLCARKYGWPTLPLERWYCTMAEATAMALPRSLEQAAQALALPVQKDIVGRKLMLRMSRPKGQLLDGTYVWHDRPEDIARLAEYCRTDVEVERAVYHRTRRLIPAERETWLLDQRVNDRGVRIDRPLVTAARLMALDAIRDANETLALVSDGDVNAVTNVGAIAAWLRERGVAVEKLRRHDVTQLLKDPTLPSDVRLGLTQRLEAGRSSVSKLDTMLAYASPLDDRMRGLLLYHGATTGRWAGRGFQPQNLPRGDIGGVVLDTVREAVRNGDAELARLFAPILSGVSSMLRQCLVSAPGHVFLAADAAQIEARLTAYLAGQTDLVTAFAAGEDVYQKTATRLGTTRQSGKAVVLGCGFGMGAKKFVTMAETAYNMKLTEDEATRFVTGYRTMYPRIPELWRAMQHGVLQAVTHPGDISAVALAGGTLYARFLVEAKADRLWLVLPSGRPLCYHRPRLVERLAPWGDLVSSVEVMTVSQFSYKWEPVALYGGLLTENLVQAAARDVLVHSMKTVEAAGFPVVLTVHDELVVEVPEARADYDAFLALVKQPPAWAAGCPLSASGWQGTHYRKG